jgi:hypothetical protein
MTYQLGQGNGDLSQRGQAPCETCPPPICDATRLGSGKYVWGLGCRGLVLGAKWVWLSGDTGRSNVM